MELDEQVDPLETDHSLCVVLPGGLEKTVTVHGSKPVMDFLVTLCATYHLNPSDYTVEALSANKNIISFKANSPVGLLEAEKIVLKPKAVEEKLKQPYVPEATVRLLINYNKSQKTVVRVSPRLPLELLLPIVCDKCEFQVESTVLLLDADAKEPLDLTKTLNQLSLRELFAMDTAAPERGTPETPPRTADAEPPPREKKQKENSGFFSLFRRRKKKKQEVKQPPGAAAMYSSSTLPADLPKKRRAPPPPPAMMPSLSVPNNLSSCHLTQRSMDSTLRSTKRRAPPPPLQELQTHADVTASAGSSNTLKSLREHDDSGTSSPLPAQPLSSSRSSLNHLHQAAESCLPAFRGKDLSDARAALAKVLTSSVSKGTLIRRLRKLPHASPFTSPAPKSSGNGVFCSEFESVFTSELPTESEWEDPIERRGLTTFKVVPPKRAEPPEEDVNPEVPPEETSPNSDPEAKDNPSSSDGSEGEELLKSSSPPLQDSELQNCPDSPQQEEENQPEDSDQVEPAKQTEGGEGLGRTADRTDSEHQEESDRSCSEEKVQEEEVNFPPPPPPIFFEDATEENAGAEPTTEPSSPTWNGRCEAESASAGPRRSQSASAPSRFAQAVARAVQRSRRLSHSKSSGPEASGGASPPRSTYQYGA